MKKQLLFLAAALLFASLGTVNAFSAPVFDSCGDSTKYSNQEWYKDMEKQFLQKSIGLSVDKPVHYYQTMPSNWNQDKNIVRLVDMKQYPVDICYSKSQGIAIVNVPLIQAKQDKYGRNSSIVNIFQYNFDKKTLSQANFNNANYGRVAQTGDKLFDSSFSEYVEYSSEFAIHKGFGKRFGNNIILKSGYGDAGNCATFWWSYNYKSNTTSLRKSTPSCSM